MAGTEDFKSHQMEDFYRSGWLRSSAVGVATQNGTTFKRRQRAASNNYEEGLEEVFRLLPRHGRARKCLLRDLEV
ncbi:hypothetical protein GOBAR_AA06181 [Gossypium barbadense]|uniref:Uncharacterized protein n=1 Tax=Gossypium barbadense TaxID=3634 RepID=A0A2P5YFP4_GOSBA|nr:hypothetical protein GOBAR_AA06181 [Gossypium barbadense]